MMQHKIVSQSEWTAQRKAFLAKEKEFTRARDQLSAERRKLPMGQGGQGLRVRHA